MVDGSAIVGTGCAGFVAKERYFKRKRTGLGSYVVGIRNWEWKCNWYVRGDGIKNKIEFCINIECIVIKLKIVISVVYIC